MNRINGNIQRTIQIYVTNIRSTFQSILVFGTGSNRLI